MNMQVDISKIHNIVYTHCRNVTVKNNGDINCSCPVCGDSKHSSKKKRLHIDFFPQYDTHIVKCYNGGCRFNTAVNFISFYATLTRKSYSDAKKELIDPVYDKDVIKKTLTKTHIEDIIIEGKHEQLLDINLLQDCYTLETQVDSKRSSALIEKFKQFVTGRKINFKCYVAHSGRYQGRIIIPIYSGDELVYFQGRAIDEAIEPKYLNPEVDKTKIIMNDLHFNTEMYIIVTEGPIDAYMIGDNGTCTLGTASLTTEFIETLLTKTNKGVIIAFDNDQAGKDTVTKFIQNNSISKDSKILYFIMPYKQIKDLNEYRCSTQYEIDDEHNMYDFVVKNSYKYLTALAKLKL